MTKSQLQKELLEKVKEGVKPSTLKKSKSLNDLPTSTKSPPLQHSKSTNELPLVQPTLEEQNIQLKERVQFHSQTAANYLKSLQTSQAKVSELEEKLTESNQQLDNSLQARAEAVKQFGQLAEKLKSLRKELEENITQSTDELINQDQIITKLRTNQLQAQSRIQELEKDLQLSQRLTKLKEFSYPVPENDFSYLKYIIGGLTLIILGL